MRLNTRPHFDGERKINCDPKMSVCLSTKDYGDGLFTFLVCKQKTPVTSSIRIFERADFGQTSEIVSITDRDTNLKEEILKEDCGRNCSQISCWRLR